MGNTILSALWALTAAGAPVAAGEAPAPAPDPAVARNEAEAGMLLLQYLAAQRAYATIMKKFAAGFGAGAGANKPAALSDADRARLAKLIGQLGEDDFAEREAASAAIEKFGPAALPLVEEALGKSKDAEVASRLEALVKKLRPAPPKNGPPQLLGAGKDVPWSKVERSFADAVTGGKALSGYRFVRLEKDAAGKALGPRRHAIAAVPEEHGRTGRATLLAWDDLDAKLVCGELVAKDTAGKLPEALPADTAKEGWKPPAPAAEEKPGPRARALETNAIGSCRAYCAAQVMFHRNDWDADGVLEYAPRFPLLATTADGAGNPIQLLDNAFARASSPRRPKHGYFFLDMVAIGGQAIDWVNDYALCAVPAEYGRTGKLTFIVCTNGTVFGKDTGGKPVFDYPADPAAAGWVIAE